MIQSFRPSVFKVPVSFFAILLVFFNYANAQYFEKVYGQNEKITPSYFATTSDHGYVILGNKADSIQNTNGYYVLKIDSNGNIVWEKSFIDAFSAFGFSITSLENGKIVMLGTHTGIQYQIVAEIRELDSNGNFLDSALYPPFDGWGTAGVGMTRSGDSTVTISLYNDGFISNNYYSVFSLNPDLTTRWSDFIGFDGSFTDEHGITSLPQANVYTISYYDIYFYTPTALFNVTDVRKYNSNGNLIFDSLYEFNCITTAVTATNDGGALICGIQDTSSTKNIVLIRLDSSGNVLWQKQYGYFTDEETNIVKETSDGRIVLLATVSDPVLPGQHDILLMKTDANGDSLWSRTFGGTLEERGIHLEEDNADLVILGYTNSFDDDHIYLIKTDSSGIIRMQYNVVANGKYFCEGDTATLLINPPPSPGAHVLWSNGDTVNSSLAMNGGNYFATITDSLGNSIRTPFVSLYFASFPDARFASDTINLCEGVMLIDSSTSEITNTYQWYADNIMLIGENFPSIIPQQPGTYKLVVSNYCSQDSSSTFINTIYANPVPPVLTAPAVNFVCPGDSLPVSITPENSISYQWFSTDNFDNYIIVGATDTVYYATNFGQYLVSATDTNGCQSYSSPYSVNFDNDQVFVSPGGPTHFCDGGEVQLSVPAGTQFNWSNGDTTQAITVDSSGDYYVSFIDDYGCPKSSDTLEINILPNPNIYLGADTTLCSDSTLVLDAGDGYNNYFWQDGSSDQNFTAFSNGPYPDMSSYFVFVTDSNGCTDSDTLRILFDICIGIDDVNNESVSLYPNPLSHGRSLQILNETNMDLTLVLSDILNQEVMRKIINHSSLISEMPDLPTGIYHYSFIRDQKPISAGKLIIQ